MADDIWSGITEGLAANRAAAQQDADNQQAQSDALAKQIAQQHTDQLEQQGLLQRGQQITNQTQQIKQQGDYQQGQLANTQAETARKTKADEDKATANAASLKGMMDRAKSALDDKGRDRVQKETDLFALQGLDPDVAAQRALANEMVRGQGYNIPIGQQSTPGTVKADAKQLRGAQAQGPAPSLLMGANEVGDTSSPITPGRSQMGPQQAPTMTGNDLMNQLMMPQQPQAGAPVQPDQGQGSAGSGSGPLPMVAAKMAESQANAARSTAQAHNFDANTNATNLLTPMKANKIQSDTDYTDWKQQEGTAWHQAMEKHWQTQAAAQKAYQDASLALRQNELNNRPDSRPIAEFRALASAKGQLANNLNGMSKQLGQMGQEKATITGLMHSPRPDAQVDPNGARQWDLMQRVGPDRLQDLDQRIPEMSGRFHDGTQDLAQMRALLLTKTNVMKDNGQTDTKGTSQLQKAAAARSKSAATGKGLPGTQTGARAKPTAQSVLNKFGIQ
jgi:hypothetical protein